MEIAKTWYFQIWVNFGGMAEMMNGSHLHYLLC